MTDIKLLRYTSLAVTIDLLSRKQITLLDPANWDDRNDAYFMSVYQQRSRISSLLALCFAEDYETYHHWKVFSHGPSGCCLEFDKKRLVESISAVAGTRHGAVEYKAIDALRNLKALPVEQLPFLKRYPYRDEKEYRFVYEADQPNLTSIGFDINLSWIKRITLSPWMHKSLEASIKKTLKLIDGCQNIKIYRSTLLENERWKALANGAVATP